jgi:hypothetical protein
MELSSTFQCKYKWCKSCRYMSYITYCESCIILPNKLPSRYLYIQRKYVLLFKYQYGIHPVIRESQNCYWIWDSTLNRRRGYIKIKWYVIKLWW